MGYRLDERERNRLWDVYHAVTGRWIGTIRYERPWFELLGLGAATGTLDNAATAILHYHEGQNP